MITTDKLIITIADVKDAELLTKLSVTTFCDAFSAVNRQEDMDAYISEAMSLERLTEELLDNHNLFFLAWYDNAAAGYAKIRTTEIPNELKTNNPIELERIYVLQAYQNKKIGNAMLDHCINYAVNQKHDIMWLGVWEHNHGAKRFYERWGFKLFGAHDFVLGSDVQTDVLMKKML